MTIFAKGVDVSSNNCSGTGNIDFNAVKRAGYDFAMVRIGYTTLTNNLTGAGHGTYISKSFAPQMQAATEAGLDVGVYWYSKAFTAAQARTEARVVLDAVKPYKLAYPIAFDMEHPPVIGGWATAGRQYAGLPLDVQLDIIDGFMREIETAKYYAMLYMSQSPLDRLRAHAPARIDQYACWVAQYAPRCTYSGKVGIWQHHGDLRGYVGQISGVQGPIDLNDCYVDYPSLIRKAGLNGLSAEPETPQPESKIYTLNLSELSAQGFTEIKIKI